MTNICTIISQIITLLHVSTLSCHLQGACNQYPAKLRKISNAAFAIQYATFTFTLPCCCIVIDFFSNNQPDALIIQIYSVIKLYMFRASSLPIIGSFLLYIRHWWVSCRFLMTASKQNQDGTAEQFHPDSETFQCRMYSRKLLMMGREDARNM
jgi:hypothetical protein